jgi:proteasome lid subunit RPN8/RPN11
MSDNFFHNLRFTLPLALIMWALFVWLVLAIFSEAQADETNTPAEMAAAELQRAMELPDAKKFEYAGVVIAQVGGGYRTTPLQRYDEATFKLVVKIVHGEKIVAIYHTHPPGKQPYLSERASPQDHEASRALHIPSYIGVVSSKQIIKVTV